MLIGRRGAPHLAWRARYESQPRNAGVLDLDDLMRRFLRWYEEGENSVTGRCFDIGNTTRIALERFARTEETAATMPPDPRQAGNGTLMRLAPVAILAAPDIDAAADLAEAQSRAGIVTLGQQGRAKERIGPHSGHGAPSGRVRSSQGFLGRDGLARRATPDGCVSAWNRVLRSCPISWCSWREASTIAGLAGMIRLPQRAG